MAAADWFSGARLGLFIHYDHASQQGVELSWPLLGRAEDPGRVEHAADYHATASSFDPVRWDPVDLARHAADAGMRYAVFTTKHHSGWTAWPSKVAPFTIASSPYGRRGGDLVRSYTDAFRAAGIKVGLYFSLADWSHPDYPAWTDEQRPYDFQTGPRIVDQAGWHRFRQVLKDELTELLTDYGPIDLLWFDGQWERSPEVWGTAELREHIHRLAPEVVINDRLTDAGDYATPEQAVPAHPPDGPWETCLTMNDSWGYIPSDQHYKSATRLITSLAEIASKGGNLLLNIGPQPDGSVPQQELTRLDQIGAWLTTHGESIFDTSPGLEPWQFYGPSTQRGNAVYLHMVGWPLESVSVRGVRVARAQRAHLLGSDDPLPLDRVVAAQDGFAADPIGELTIALPDRPDDPLPVIKVEFSG